MYPEWNFTKIKMRNQFRILFALLFLIFIAVACADIQPAPYPLGAVVNTNTTTPYALNLPANMPPMAIPDDNPLTVEGSCFNALRASLMLNLTSQYCGVAEHTLF